MKKQLLTLCMLTSIAYSQTQLSNNHWINYGTISSPSLHLKFEGYSNGRYNYMVENKQPCNVLFSVYMGSLDTMFNVGEGKTKHLSFIAPFNADTIWAKAITNCSSTYDTCYWGVTTIKALPVQLSNIKAARLANNSIKVEFDAANVQATEQVLISYSFDAKNYTLAFILYPEVGDETKHYTKIINVK